MGNTQPQQRAITLRAATREDLPAVLELLTAAGLPTEEVEIYLDNFFVACDGARLIGSAGLEVHGEAGLVRSVAVRPEWRGQKIAERLFGEVVKRARERGVGELVLLTAGAQGYFARFGFKPVGRVEVAPELLESAQFRGVCPTSAICMRLVIGCKPAGMQLKRG